MAEHWTEREKHKAKRAFEHGEPAPQQTQPPSPQRPPQPPQPQLTPSGPMRETVNRQVREKQAAIKAKLARDRETERER